MDKGRIRNFFYFHNIARRRNKNLIELPLKDDGVGVKDNEIKEEIISFFSNLYGPQPAPRPFLEGLEWCPILERENEELKKS